MDNYYADFLKYLEHLYSLHEMIANGNGDGEVADNLRDKMDFIKLHPELYKCAKMASEALYKISDEEVSHSLDQHLTDLGLSVVHIDTRENILHVYLENEDNENLVPTEWRDFKVVLHKIVKRT